MFNYDWLKYQEFYNFIPAHYIHVKMLEAWFGLKDENPSLGISSYQVVPSIIFLWFDEVEVVDDQ